MCNSNVHKQKWEITSYTDTHTCICTYIHELRRVVRQCDTNTWLIARPVTWLLEIWQYNTVCKCCRILILCPLSSAMIVVMCVSNTVRCFGCRHFYLILLLILRCMKHPPPVTFPCIAVLISGWWSCWLLYQTTRIATLFSNVGNFFLV